MVVGPISERIKSAKELLDAKTLYMSMKRFGRFPIERRSFGQQSHEESIAEAQVFNDLNVYLSLLASRSHSMRQRISPTRTGPLTLRMMERLEGSMNSTRTWVTPPRDPVFPSTFTTLASFAGAFSTSALK